MKKNKVKIMMVLLLLLCTVFAGGYLYNVRQAETADESYKMAEEIVNVKNEAESDEETTEYVDVFNIKALKEVNEDVLGWISIPDTKLSYPLMKGLDNKYYLEHTWDKKESKAGAIFVERLNEYDLSDIHTVIYGHRMIDATMFGSLKYYEEEDYLRENPYIYIYDEAGVKSYNVFSAYEAEKGSRTYQVGFKDSESIQDFMDYCADMSVVDTGIRPTSEDKIITLSTCTATGSKEKRFVVQAVLVESE